MSMHSIRKNFLTICLETGIDRELASKRSEIVKNAMAVDTYIHIREEYLSDQSTILANFVKDTIT